MTSEEIKSWLSDPYSSDRQERMEAWFIANIDSPELDDALQDYLERCPRADRKRVMQAFRDVCHRLGLNPPKPLLHHPGRIAIPAAVASLAIGLCVGIALTGKSEPIVPQHEWVQVYASAGTTNNVVLPDSSSLSLQPASLLIYDAATFGECRHVYLHGGAYAQITANTARPFTIQSDRTAISVVGTRFDITNYAEDREMEVRLYEGCVRISNLYASATDTLSLQPGNIIKVDKRTGARTFLDIRGLEKQAEGSFHFINRELGDIANELSRYFNVNISIDNDELRSLKFYAIFVNNESLDQILDGLNATKLLNITHTGENTITIR